MLKTECRPFYPPAAGWRPTAHQPSMTFQVDLKQSLMAIFTR